MMHERQRTSLPLPAHAELAEWMYQLACERGDEFFDSEYDTDGMPNKFRLTYERLETKCAEAATAALLGFDEGYLALQSARGKKSKRGPTYSLGILNSVPGLSITEQAAALGISPSTVSRRRRQTLAATRATRDARAASAAWADDLLADFDLD